MEKEKGQTTIYKTLHRKLKIEKHEPHQKSGVNSGAPEGLAVPAPHVALEVDSLLSSRVSNFHCLIVQLFGPLTRIHLFEFD